VDAQIGAEKSDEIKGFPRWHTGDAEEGGGASVHRLGSVQGKTPKIGIKIPRSHENKTTAAKKQRTRKKKELDKCRWPEYRVNKQRAKKGVNERPRREIAA